VKYACLFLFATLLWSCAPQGANRSQTASVPLQHTGQHTEVFEQQTELTVSITPDRVSDFQEICTQLQDQAWEQGLEKLLHVYVNQAMLVRPGVDRHPPGPVDPELSGDPAVPPGLEQTTTCAPWQDLVTGLIAQKMRFSTTLRPVERFSGTIDALQANLTMGGMLSKSYVTLKGPAVSPTPIPVLIVQQSSGLEKGLLQVVGSGRITQVTSSTGQMEILESTREILPGDLFYQLVIQTRTLPMDNDFIPLRPEMSQGGE
jgi:hypothetical protein